MTDLGRVAIIGTGQMGTTIGRALTALPPGTIGEVLAWDPDAAALENCLALGGAHRRLSSGLEALDAEVIVLAAPVDAAVTLIGELGPRLRPDQLLLDTGSAKVQVVAAMRRMVAAGAGAVGGHPLCGGTGSGPAAGDPARLLGATFVLCPVREDARALEVAGRLVGLLGARQLVLSAAEHDRALARTSHLPHLTAAALAQLCTRGFGESAPRLSAGGLRGAVRLARSDPAMVASFICANLEEVRTAVAELTSQLNDLLGKAEAGQSALEAELGRARMAALGLGDDGQ